MDSKSSQKLMTRMERAAKLLNRLSRLGKLRMLVRVDYPCRLVVIETDKCRALVLRPDDECPDWLVVEWYATDDPNDGSSPEPGGRIESIRRNRSRRGPRTSSGQSTMGLAITALAMVMYRRGELRPPGSDREQQ